MAGSSFIRKCFALAPVQDEAGRHELEYGFGSLPVCLYKQEGPEYPANWGAMSCCAQYSLVLGMKPGVTTFAATLPCVAASTWLARCLVNHTLQSLV
jgi:hypothetical protein